MDYSSNSNNPKGFSSAEELLKSQTVGLVHLSDFRKRRAEAIEITESQDKYARDRFAGGSGGSGVKGAESKASESKLTKKRKKITSSKTKLSFDVDELDEEDIVITTASDSRKGTPADLESETINTNTEIKEDETIVNEASSMKRRLGPNTTISAPRTMTKWGLAKEAQERERLRRDFLQIQDRVKATDILIPFVFFDGAVQPGGKCLMKKGDNVWLFLDKARKLGAELGVGGERRKKEWARVGIDDLMVVRGDIILPHHYEFYYFMLNNSIGFHGRLFEMSAQPTNTTPDSMAEVVSKYDPLLGPEGNRKKMTNTENLEGADDDPMVTKVVDRRWYDRNKHLFPASLWEEFDPTNDYSKKIRTDSQGNSFFRAT